MPSQRQISANQRNARKSTGPRSQAGKKRASGNARRHGLSVSVGLEPSVPSIESYLDEIVGPSAEVDVRCRARAIVLAECEIDRVRRTKKAVLERHLALLSEDVLEDMRTALALLGALPDLQAIERYEKRAYARREEAVRRFSPVYNR